MEKKELRVFIHEVSDLLIEVEKTHRYSMSKIYGLYNKVFEKNETPQSCASCLIRKVNELKTWLETEKLKAEKEKVNIKGSLKELSNLKSEYAELTKEQRESEIGTNMLTEIQILTEENKPKKRERRAK